MPNPDYFVLPPDQHFGRDLPRGPTRRVTCTIVSRGNAKGNLHGGSATQLFEFDEKGKFVRELGRDLYSFGYAHGVTVDKNDDIWVVDKGTDMVTKFNNRTGRVSLVLGRREEAELPLLAARPGRRPAAWIGAGGRRVRRAD